MSVQFGKCNFDGKPVDSRDFDKVRPLFAPYGPDEESCVCRDNLGVLYRAFHTTKESRREIQPHISKFGFVLVWDGRLDNRNELISEIAGEVSRDSTDMEIVAAAYQRWATEAFAKLTGDWALSIWDRNDRSLILAKDFVGTRHLYYTVEKATVTWCTILDPLVLFAQRPLKLEEEYIAGWLAFFPAPHLTPYVGIHSVPPSSFVRLSKGSQQIRKYWDFDPAKRIRYRTDGEYEEHFRVALAESVRRRLRSDSPILAELSGGMDSSSIVCMADLIISQGRGESPRLDTISYYDDSEPNWNERPYFTKVEQQRGRTGCHIDVAALDTPSIDCVSVGLAASPSMACFGQADQQFADYVRRNGHRILLSGIGGDEVTGGLPTPIPELADLLARGRVSDFVHKLKIWSLNKRKPWFHLFGEVVQRFLPLAFSTVQKRASILWLNPEFTQRNRNILSSRECRLRWFGPLPSFQENMNVIDSLRAQVGCSAFAPEPNCDRRYPYLDRDFLEVIFAVPREQLVRPGQRRSLMRRALKEIVPEEVLNRKRKAYVGRAPVLRVAREWSIGERKPIRLVTDEFGFVDSSALCDAVNAALRGREIPVVTLNRTMILEHWLQELNANGFLALEPSKSIDVLPERHSASARLPVS